MTSTSDAIAMNGVSAWGWIRTSVEANDRDAWAHRELALGAKLIRILGREPLREHVHRGFGLSQSDALAQTGFYEKGRDDRGASRGAKFAKTAGTAVIGSQKSVPRPMSTVPR